MANISVFLDTDVLINWLAKEIDQKPGKNSGELLIKFSRRLRQES